ncbi:MAG: PIG-L deacetylase family protein [Planctomycetota bacterium]|nr:PIG-L deacetylase family protein [Planctomycetota bacterium]
MSTPLKILVFGAHPDDCEIKFGGTAALYARAGHHVRFVSVTNGNTGHHEIGGVELAKIRAQEAANSAATIGIEYVIMDIQSNELEPSLPYRKRIIEMIREFEPDMVATHRPCDYHPDHRYTSQLIQDASYAVTVPGVCPLTPHLRKSPVIVYLSDHFQVPLPFQARVVVDIDSVIENKVDMMHCHKSQFYEWLPYNKGNEDEVPDDEDERRAWLGETWKPSFAELADLYREELHQQFGEERGAAVQFAEAFEPCEYGAPMTAEEKARLFPFVE